MIQIETRCTTCGHAFTPAPDAFRRGTWRTCTRCRDGPSEQDSRYLCLHSRSAQGK